MTNRNPEFPSVLAGAILTAALFGLRRLDNQRGKATRPDDWRRVWLVWAELGSPPLPCTAPWVNR